MPRTPDTARDAVCLRLSQQAAVFPDFAPEGVDESGLYARDAAFAHAIYDAAIRRWSTLMTIIRSRLDKPTQPLPTTASAALLSAAAQVLLLDKVPAHAAINHSVEWAKRAAWVSGTKGAGVGGLVNAISRRIAELAAASVYQQDYTGGHDEMPLDSGGCLKLPAPVFRGDAMERLAAATGVPLGILNEWSRQHGPETATKLALHCLVRPPTVLLTKHAKGETLESSSLTRHDSLDHRVWRGERSVLSAFLGTDKGMWVQDSAASRGVEAARESAAKRGSVPKVVVDLCAGQGTKTRQLAAEFPEADIIATDTDSRRVGVLRTATAHLPKVKVVRADELSAAVAAVGGANLVLADVPCSNSGTLARRSEAKYRLGPDQLARLAGIQKEIVRFSKGLLASDGVLLYSTCSIDPMENHAIAAWAENELGLKILDEELTLPKGLPGGEVSGYADGSYWALMAAHTTINEP